MSDSKIMVGSEVNTDIAESRTKVMAGLHCGGTSSAALAPAAMGRAGQPLGTLGSIPHMGFTKKTCKEGAAKPAHDRKNVG